MSIMRRTLPLCLLVAISGYAAFSRSGVAQRKPRDGASTATAKRADSIERLPIVDDDKFDLGISSKKSEFRAGENVDIDIALTNNGESKPRIVLLTPVQESYDIEVTPWREADRLPSVALRRYAGSDESITLKHGLTLTGTVRLNNLYDLSLYGTYMVRVSKRFRYQDARKAPVVVRSNTLTIKITSDAFLSDWYGVTPKP